MNIDTSNFLATKAAMLDAIEQADFIAIDTELSGLFVPGEKRSSPTDTLQQTYDRIRQSSKQFSLLQFGISCFKYDAITTGYVVRTYNVYIFPRSGRGVADRSFLFSNSGIEFLLEYKFDFNKCFRQGVSYASKKEEEDFVRAQAKKVDAGNDVVPLGRHEATVNTFCETVQNWVTNEASKSITIPAKDGFLRRLLYQEIALRFADQGLACSTNKVENGVDFAVTRQTAEEKEEVQKIKQAKLDTDREAFVGFRAIMDKISSHQKLVISHNGFYDLGHVLQKFHTDLPESLEDFKQIMHAYLPSIIDTKQLATHEAVAKLVTDTSLGVVFEAFNKEPYTTPSIATAEGFQNYATCTSKPHEAGYDSYMTGCAFVRMLHCIEQQRLTEGQSLALPLDLLSVATNLGVVNKIPVPTPQAFLTLDGVDTPPPSNHIFAIYDFPKDWKTRHIIAVFEAYGSVRVRWLNDTSALVTLDSVDRADQVQSDLVANVSEQPRLFKVCPFSQHHVASASNIASSNDLASSTCTSGVITTNPSAADLPSSASGTDTPTFKPKRPKSNEQ